MRLTQRLDLAAEEADSTTTHDTSSSQTKPSHWETVGVSLHS